MIAAIIWYQVQLRPVDSSNSDTVIIKIESGATPGQIARELKNRELIRSPLAFSIHAKIHRLSGGLQAGMHRLSPSQSTPEITKRLQQAENDEISVQFVPGSMLRDNSQNTPDDKKQDVRSTLERLGYSREEIERAFKADYSEYDDTLFKGRPADAGIEGYVYGETYRISADSTVEQILRRTFDEFVRQIEKNNLEEKFASQGLTLYQGIILASIVQRESVGCGAGSVICEDQRQIASVFFNRLAADMTLGSDVTYHYAADAMGVERDVNLDSPYNTRKYKGLPPGPIATPGLSALNAVADPARTEYLFFLSGDDDITYFAQTNEDHDQNIRNHCHEKCLLP